MSIPTGTLSNGFTMPIFGVGTWGMGGGRWEPDTSNDTDEIVALRLALERGVTLIDTAEMYGGGHAEELVGAAIKDLDRQSLFVTSKVFPNHLHREEVRTSAHKSLERLGTDYLDLYLIHAPNPDVPITETMEALNELLAEGLVKAIGVSNFTKEQLEEAQNSSLAPLVVNQVQYNLRIREPESTGLLEYCQSHEVIMQAWRPILNVELGVEVLGEIAAKYEKSPVQVAINWLISQKMVTTIAKSTSPEHLDENLGALGWNLAREDVERLREEFPDESDTARFRLRS